MTCSRVTEVTQFVFNTIDGRGNNKKRKKEKKKINIIVNRTRKPKRNYRISHTDTETKPINKIKNIQYTKTR